MSKIRGLFKVKHKRVGYKRVGVKRGEETKRRLKVSSEELCEDPKNVLKSRSFLKFLNNQELGVTSGIQAKKEFYEIKTSQKEKVSSSKLSIPICYDFCEVKLIAGDDHSLFGVWYLSKCHVNSCYIRGEISYNVNNENYAQTYKICNNITDMCRGSSEFITVSSEHKSPKVQISDFYCYYEGRCCPPWYCCCYFPESDSAVFGGDGFVLFYSQYSPTNYYKEYPAKVCTLSQHLPSKLVLVGLQTGVFHIKHPSGDPDACYSVKVSDEAINDSLFLNHQEVIVTNVKGKLVKVDLRTRKTSAMFLGHKHSVTKSPFSVANDMLCATGSDNVVRIWHISGGHPIHVQKSNSEHKVKGWLHSDANKTYLNYFERDTRTVFTI